MVPISDHGDDGELDVVDGDRCSSSHLHSHVGITPGHLLEIEVLLSLAPVRFVLVLVLVLLLLVVGGG